MRSPRRVLALTTVAAVALGGGGAALAASTGGPTPSYPNSRLTLSVSKTTRAASIGTVRVSGTNAPFSNNDTANPSYTVEVFVQLRSELPTCPRAYSDQLNNVINLGSNTITQIARNYNVGKQGPFNFSFKYRTGASRRVVYCGYTRLITDDAANAQLRQTLAKARRR